MPWIFPSKINYLTFSPDTSSSTGLITLDTSGFLCSLLELWLCILTGATDATLFHYHTVKCTLSAMVLLQCNIQFYNCTSSAISVYNIGGNRISIGIIGVKRGHTES